MMKRIFPLFFVVIGWGCQKPNQPVPAAHTDTFIAYPAADTLVIDTLIQQPDSIQIDSNGMRADTTLIH